jgi:outer membrane protein TolC
MKKVKFIAVFMLAMTSVSRAQVVLDSLTLEACWTLSKKNYPLVKQLGLIEKTKELSLENATKSLWPQIVANAQASYQSEVTKLNIAIPGVPSSSLNKDQYKLYVDVSQSLTDAPIVKAQKEVIQANSVIDAQKVEVELFKLRDRVNQLFLGMLMFDEQLAQTELLKKDLKTTLEKVKAAIANGTSLKMNADVLRAELLKLDQRTIELQTNRQGLADVLSVFLKQTVENQTVLVRPIGREEAPVANTEVAVNRPELKLFEVQKNVFASQERLVDLKTKPRVNLFLQTGFGRPALNALSNDFGPYAIGGLRASWNLSSFYTFKKEKDLLNLNKNLLDIQKETFLMSTNLAVAQQQSEIKKLRSLINTDNDIIELRKSIKSVANVQLSNGVLTANDFLSYVNAQDQAQQNLTLHQMQLLLAQYNLQNTLGN